MISPKQEPKGDSITGMFSITMSLDELIIGPGDFVVSAALFRTLDPSKNPEDGAYDLRDREYALKIIDSDHQPYPAGLIRQKAQWSYESC
jgi:lipopolysaccharide transport system ATP-binding protein